MNLTSQTWVTERKGWCSPSHVADAVNDLLESLKLDWWNDKFVIRVSVDSIDTPPKPGADDE